MGGTWTCLPRDPAVPGMMEPLISHPRSAWGGIVGPAAFVSAWLVGGAMRRGYMPVDAGISRLAAVGAPTRPLMMAGFVGFGVGVPVYAVALRGSVPGSAWKWASPRRPDG